MSAIDMDATYTFELVNPSDHYTMVGRPEPCAIASILLGGGMYAVRDEASGWSSPIVFGGHSELDERWQQTFGRPFPAADDAMAPMLAEVIDALESVLIGSRRRFDELISFVPEQKRAAFREAWHDTHRTSMNDIGANARELAEQLRRAMAEATA